MVQKRKNSGLLSSVTEELLPSTKPCYLDSKYQNYLFTFTNTSVIYEADLE